MSVTCLSVDSVRRTHTNCTNDWSSRPVNMSWKWRCAYWSTSLLAPRAQDQQWQWLQPRDLLKPTSSSPCCWRSTTLCVKLHAPSAAFYSPWWVCPERQQLIRDVAPSTHGLPVMSIWASATAFVGPGERAPPEIPGDVGAAQQAPFWESGVLWTHLAQQFTCTGCTAEVRYCFTTWPSDWLTHHNRVAALWTLIALLFHTCIC